MANRTWLGSGSWATAGNWAENSVPVAGDNVRITAGAGSITAGLNQSAVALGYVIVEPGYTGTIGVAPVLTSGATAAAVYLQIVCTRFEFSGTGNAWIDIGTSAISPQIFDTANPSAGNRGLYLKGSAIATLNVTKGKVGLAHYMGETSTCTTLRCAGKNAGVWCGSGVTLTTFYQSAGDSELKCAATTVNFHGGKLKTRETGAITTINVYGGDLLPESTGTITTLNQYDGLVDFTGSAAARTVTTYVRQRATAHRKLDRTFVTITTDTPFSSHPVDETFAAAA